MMVIAHPKEMTNIFYFFYDLIICLTFNPTDLEVCWQNVYFVDIEGFINVDVYIISTEFICNCFRKSASDET